MSLLTTSLAYTVPTWARALALALMVVALVAIGGKLCRDLARGEVWIGKYSQMKIRRSDEPVLFWLGTFLMFGAFGTGVFAGTFLIIMHCR